MNKNKGISLIVLIVTIIVIIILAAVVVLTISKNNPIESAKEARFKEDVRTFQDELAMSVSKEYAQAGGHRDYKINASDFEDIKGYIPSFNEKYKDKFVIEDDELKYTKKLKDKEIDNVKSLNINKEKILPNEYQQVEYIESTGTQYIDTDLVSSKNVFEYSAEVSATQLTGTGQQILFGATNGFNVTIMSKIYRATSKCITNIRINIDKFDKINLISNPIDSKLKLTINDITKTATYTNFVMNEKIGIFGYANGICKAKCRIKKLKISIDGEDRADFIPCYSVTNVTNSDNIQCSSGTIGMYDIVEGKFYTNQGTGEFIAGPDVNE